MSERQAKDGYMVFDRITIDALMKESKASKFGVFCVSCTIQASDMDANGKIQVGRLKINGKDI